MKKFLQKSCAWLVMLVAMFAMSMNAMADETVEFRFYQTGDGSQTLENNGVTLQYYGYNTSWDYTASANVWSSADNYSLFIVSEAEIVSVEMTRCSYYDQGVNLIYEANYAGSWESQSSDYSKWIAPAGTYSVRFHSSGDVYVGNVKVTYKTAPFVECDYTVTAPEGVNVSIKGSAVDGSTYHATEKFNVGDVAVTDVPDGYKAIVAVDHENKTVTVTLEEIVPAKVTSVYPTPGEIRLDDDEYGLRNIHLVFEGSFDKAVYAGDGFPVPAGVTITKDGTTPITINPSYGFTMWQGGTECYVNTTPSSLVEPGTYELHIPAGINTIGGKPTEEVNVTWTVVAASTFKLENNSVEILGEKWDNAYMKSVTGLSVALPAGETFKEFGAEKAVELRNEDYTFSPVAASWAENDGVVTITFATPVILDGEYTYRIAEGSIVLADGRYNKEVGKTANVTRIFKFNATSVTPVNWSTIRSNQIDENFEFTFTYPVEIDDVDLGSFAFTQPAIQLNTDVVDYTVDGNTFTFKFKKAWLDANYDTTFGALNDYNQILLHVDEMAVLDADLNYSKPETFLYTWRVLPYFTMGDAEWCTYSSTDYMVVPEGYTAYYVSGFEGESVILSKVGDAGKTIYNYNGYIINGPAGKVYYETGYYWDAVSPNGNYLVANAEESKTVYATDIAATKWDIQIDAPVESCKLYQLSYDNNGENLGFYTQTGTDGASIDVPKGKAFLFVPERAAGSIKRFVLEDGTVVTGLTAVEVPMEKDAIYNLQGQRVNATEKGGVYVKNGKKFIVK